MTTQAKPSDVLQKIDRENRGQGVPLHVRVRQALRALIDKHFEDGQQFWTEAVLVERLGVSQITIRRAVLDLCNDGLLDRRGAKGTFVCKGLREATANFSVGVVVPEYDSEVTTGLVNQLSIICRDHGRRMSMYHTHKGEKASSVIDLLRESIGREHFVLLGNSTELTLHLYRTLAEEGCRVVSVDSLIEDYPGPYVGVDDGAGIEMGLNHLVGLGHEEIVFLVNEPAEQGTVVARIHAFDQLTRTRGLIKSRVFLCQTALWANAGLAAYHGMEALWRQGHRPTAVFTISDAGAFGVLRWLAKNNVRVPEQISVLGFGNDSPGSHTTPELTTIAQPYREIATRAIEVLENDVMETSHSLFTPKLIVRESTAAISSQQ